MPEILYRDDVHKFSVYRLADIPDGVPRSGWANLEYWRTGRTVALYGHDRAWLSNYRSADEHCDPPSDATCCVADEHAGPLLQSASRFAVGMRVRPSAEGRLVYCWLISNGVIVAIKPTSAGNALEVRLDGNEHPFLYGESMWEPESPTPTAPDPTESLSYHEFKTRHLGARHGERDVDYSKVGRVHPAFVASSNAWSAHLSHLVQQSAERDRQREAAACGWDPFGDY